MNKVREFLDEANGTAVIMEAPITFQTSGDLIKVIVNTDKLKQNIKSFLKTNYQYHVDVKNFDPKNVRIVFTK